VRVLVTSQQILAVSFVLPKLYSNTVLLSLNSRPISRPDDNSVSMSNLTGQESTYYQDSQVKVRDIATASCPFTLI
jgi:hypothetical protein